MLRRKLKSNEQFSMKCGRAYMSILKCADAPRLTFTYLNDVKRI